MHTILIIEDDEISAEIYKNKLESEGYITEIALDGESGYDQLENFQPDLVLVDLMLPKLSGLEVIELIRLTPQLKHLPVIAYSASDSESILALASHLGANQVFSKEEFSSSQIVARITETLSKHSFSRKRNWIEPQSFSEWQSPNGRVLVVDDDPIITELVRDIIQEEGYNVVSAADGREAYKILQKDNDFIACIFDINLPFIEGLDLIRHMKTEKRLMKLPIIIMTGEQDLKIQSTGFMVGAGVVLPKPFTRASLGLMFKALLRQRYDLKISRGN